MQNYSKLLETNNRYTHRSYLLSENLFISVILIHTCTCLLACRSHKFKMRTAFGWWRFYWCNVYLCYFIYMFYKFASHTQITGHVYYFYSCTMYIYLIHWRWCYRELLWFANWNRMKIKWNSIGKLWARYTN